MFERLPLPSVTQTPVLAAASPVGAPPIGTLRNARRDDTSTRVTLWSSKFPTHNAPAPEASATGRAPTGTVAAIEPDESRATTEFAATAVCEEPQSASKGMMTAAAMTAA